MFSELDQVNFSQKWIGPEWENCENSEHLSGARLWRIFNVRIKYFYVLLVEVPRWLTWSGWRSTTALRKESTSSFPPMVATQRIGREHLGLWTLLSQEKVSSRFCPGLSGSSCFLTEKNCRRKQVVSKTNKQTHRFYLEVQVLIGKKIGFIWKGRERIIKRKQA